jgi:hypothetical protein
MCGRVFYSRYIACLQLLIVSRFIVHLDLQCINLEQLSPFLRLVFPTRAGLGHRVELTNQLSKMSKWLKRTGAQ